jgi:hypothetical protein
LPPNDEISAYVTSDILKICDLNADLARLRREELEKVHQHQEYLCTEADLDGVEGMDLRLLNWLRRLQASVDVTAAKYQRRVVGEWSPGLPSASPPSKARAPVRPLPALGALFKFAIAVPIAALFLEIYAHLWHHLLVLLFYLIVIGGTLGYYMLRVRRRRWQERFQDYRALAEALRVQFYWASVGVPVAVSDNYLGHQSDELRWIRQGLRGPALWAMAAGLAVRKPLLLLRWIKDQHRYFLGKGDNRSGNAWENARAAERMEWAAWGLLIAVLLPAAGLFLAHWRFSVFEFEEKMHILDWLVVLLGLLPALAAFPVVIAEGRAYKEHSRAYARAGKVFAQAAERAEALSPEDIAEWRELALALGREALDETAWWLENHRERPIASKAG